MLNVFLILQGADVLNKPSLYVLQASVIQGTSPAMGSNPVRRALREPTNQIWDGPFASLVEGD